MPCRGSRLLLCAVLAVAPALVIQAGGPPQARIVDLAHYSKVFGEERHFRVFLPPEYESVVDKRYPVIYFFHGFGQRYNSWGGMPNGDIGTDYGGDNVASFVGSHDVIVVRWDGYNPRTPGENYVRPYNIGPVETSRQFPLYFPELVDYVDTHFRTIADRDHRATSGLSMGGFMSFWIAGKYPHLVSSASNFMGSSEFTVGPKEMQTEYRHTEMCANYEGVRTRIVTGSRDFIRWYHSRMNAIWNFTRPFHETAEFDSEHGTPGMAQTLQFHMNAFQNPLPKPLLWHHADVYPTFEVWGYSVSTDRQVPGFTVLENVCRSGFRSSVREWLPDGALLPAVAVRIATDRLYRAGSVYSIGDLDLDSGQVINTSQTADKEGRLHFVLTGARHEIGITGNKDPVLTIAGWRVVGAPWATAGKSVRLTLMVLNKGSRTAKNIAGTVSSPNPSVSFERAAFSLPRLAPGAQAAGEIGFVVRDAAREVVSLQVHLAANTTDLGTFPVIVPLRPNVAAITEFSVADGVRLPLWRQAVHKNEETLGSGNADGVANPGETIAIVVPDRDAFRPVELFTSDACTDNTRRISDSWAGYDHVGESDKSSLPVISANCPAGHEIVFFARYKLPHKPDHILKQGIVRIRVSARTAGGT
jgi:hypothetical protein